METLVGADADMSAREIANDAIAKFAEADGGTVDKLNEVLDWFNGISADSATGAGAQLIADVNANKTAIGVQGSDSVEATGLYKLIADLSKRVDELETQLNANIAEKVLEETTRAEAAEEAIREVVAGNTTAIETNAANIQTISDTLSLGNA